MHSLHDDIDTLRAFMRDLYRDMPAMRGEVPLIAVTPVGEVFVHPDKRAAKAFAQKAQALFQDPASAAMWERTIKQCRQWKTSLYNPFLDAFIINVDTLERNGGVPLDFVLRHELGHALDDLDMDQYRKFKQRFEMTADAFACLHHLREHPGDLPPIAAVANMRQHDSRGKLRHPFNTVAAILDAVTYAQTHDITAMPLSELITVAQDIAAACPAPLKRDKQGRFTGR